MSVSEADRRTALKLAAWRVSVLPAGPRSTLARRLRACWEILRGRPVIANARRSEVIGAGLWARDTAESQWNNKEAGR